MNRRRLLISSGLALGSIGLGSVYWFTRWKYIVVHHSAGSYGNIDFLQKVHRERQASDPIDAIPYHYIVGNGNGMGMGEVDSDWRQKYNLWGAHVSAKNRDYNFRGIGICLIGNFENNPVPPEQYTALVNLTKRLMRKYGISAQNVHGHGLIKGQSTQCPGQYFPIEQLIKDIS